MRWYLILALVFWCVFEVRYGVCYCVCLLGVEFSVFLTKKENRKKTRKERTKEKKTVYTTYIPKRKTRVRSAILRIASQRNSARDARHRFLRTYNLRLFFVLEHVLPQAWFAAWPSRTPCLERRRTRQVERGIFRGMEIGGVLGCWEAIFLVGGLLYWLFAMREGCKVVLVLFGLKGCFGEMCG